MIHSLRLSQRKTHPRENKRRVAPYQRYLKDAKLRSGNWALKNKTLPSKKLFLGWELNKLVKNRLASNGLKRNAWVLSERLCWDLHEKVGWNGCLEKELRGRFWTFGWQVKGLEKVKLVGFLRKFDFEASCLRERSLCIFFSFSGSGERKWWVFQTQRKVLCLFWIWGSIFCFACRRGYWNQNTEAEWCFTILIKYEFVLNFL